jgi:3-deoxy-manno-octulosonate cytidylyltransferase (CMP-KDO synthetase)
VIPARWGSTRFPGKSLVSICGRPLLHWVVENARRSRRLDTLIVATDDERIAESAQLAGVRAVMTKPEHPSGTDRVAEAVADLEGDVVINVQGDEPLLDPRLIDRLADVFEDERWDMSTAVTPITDPSFLRNPGVVKAIWDADGAALYFSRSLIPFVRDPDDAPAGTLHWRHLGVYGYRRSFLERLVKTEPCQLEKAEKLEQLRALHIGGRIAIIQTEDEGIGVDTPQDVAYVERLIRQREEQSTAL